MKVGIQGGLLHQIWRLQAQRPTTSLWSRLPPHSSQTPTKYSHWLGLRMKCGLRETFAHPMLWSFYFGLYHNPHKTQEDKNLAACGPMDWLGGQPREPGGPGWNPEEGGQMEKKKIFFIYFYFSPHYVYIFFKILNTFLIAVLKCCQLIWLSFLDLFQWFFFLVIDIFSFFFACLPRFFFLQLHWDIIHIRFSAHLNSF